MTIAALSALSILLWSCRRSRTRVWCRNSPLVISTDPRPMGGCRSNLLTRPRGNQ
ncbi:MAG: hypothetical protein ACLQIB_27315 [Isosphaeraceae bacterium]